MLRRTFIARFAAGVALFLTMALGAAALGRYLGGLIA